MRSFADFSTEAGADGGETLVFSGPMVVSGVGKIDRRLRELEGPIKTIDLGQIESIDTVGAWTAWRTAREHDAKIVNCSPKVERLIEAVSKAEGGGAIRPIRAKFFERVPEATGDRDSKFCSR